MTARPLSPAEAEVVARFDAAEPAPESWRGDDGLREAIVAGLRAMGGPRSHAPELADAVLALPEVAALRAKAAAADRVRELAARWADTDPDDANDDYGAGWDAAERQCAFDLRRALGGPSSC